MMAHTDRHFRYLLRLLSERSMLYTEMLTTGALLYGDVEKHARFNDAERPVGIQLGGSIPDDLASCARIAADFGYDEINLNVGCPSERVKSGHFGACLMAEPELVADCVRAMVEATELPVTVKTRTGIDDQDDYERLQGFVAAVSDAGCRVFYHPCPQSLAARTEPSAEPVCATATIRSGVPLETGFSATGNHH